MRRELIKPLTVTLSASAGALVRDVAQAQGVTYPSLVEAIVRQALMSGGRPVVLEPGGNKEDAV